MKKRLLASILSAVLSLSLMAGCSNWRENDDGSVSDDASTETESVEMEEEPELTKITLNEVAHSIFYAPMYVAIEEDYFADEGIELDLVCGFGDNILGRDTVKKPRIYVV